MKYFLIIFLLAAATTLKSQKTYSTFELRYFTSDSAANGSTDFKGETEWMSTDQRVNFLNDYARYASHYFKDPGFEHKVVSDIEAENLLKKLKPQPLTSIRSTILLNGWKAYGYKQGMDVAEKEHLDSWLSFPGAEISSGALELNNTKVNYNTGAIDWRFAMEGKIRLSGGSECSLLLGTDHDKAVEITMGSGMIICGSTPKELQVACQTSGEMSIRIEGDFTEKRYNLFVNNSRLQYYIPMKDTGSSVITKFSIESKGQVSLDDLQIFSFSPNGNKFKPYQIRAVLDENFEKKPDVSGWQYADFDDSVWDIVDLPSAHGGFREAGEDYYFRKQIRTGEFERATLQLETMDPGGEVWVNGQVVAVVENRHPQSLDISRFLKKNADNLIAIRIRPYQSTLPTIHAPVDQNIGWFLGRSRLILSSKCMIKDVRVHTLDIGEPAVQTHTLIIQNPSTDYFYGRVEVNYYPWYPEEGDRVAGIVKEIEVRPGIDNEYEMDVQVPSARLWDFDTPNLYRVEVILKDTLGRPVDDFVTTTGIRTVSQGEGNFTLNGKPAMLNGAQIMGFRTPIETMAKYTRCAPGEVVAREMLMIKKMGANVLRMHVHAVMDTTSGINDPRYCEFADQMGIGLMWSTASWIREGEVWNIDFDGFPEYINQVYNHPSILMWEAGNHPNRFKKHDISDTEDFIRTTYHTIYSADQSRLITLTTFWSHTWYANYDGTLDYKGNKITPVPEFNAPTVTRGSQDAYTGYGAEWTALRKAPYEWAGSCLSAGDKAYFNFEHEESISQPNWDLCKGKPWYKLQSYEWDYDKGSIGRRLTSGEWKASQAWQAFSAWESMKKQMILGYDGFSWCCLHGGPNMGTYKKPLIDNLGHAKLAFYTNGMVFQNTWAGSNDVDVVYGPGDMIKPVIHHIGAAQVVNLEIILETIDGKILERKKFRNINLPEGNKVTEIEGFRFRKVSDGGYAVRYVVWEEVRKLGS